MNRSYDLGFDGSVGETISLVLYIWQRLKTTSSSNQAAEPVPTGIVGFSCSSVFSAFREILAPSVTYLGSDGLSDRS